MHLLHLKLSQWVGLLEVIQTFTAYCFSARCHNPNIISITPTNPKYGQSCSHKGARMRHAALVADEILLATHLAL